MTDKLKIVYKSAIKNVCFCEEIEKADDDKIPSILASELEKTAFAMIYYGWLVGKYNINWKQYL